MPRVARYFIAISKTESVIRYGHEPPTACQVYAVFQLPEKFLAVLVSSNGHTAMPGQVAARKTLAKSNEHFHRPGIKTGLKTGDLV